VDNAMVVLVAGHDTSSVLMTFMVRHLAGDPATLAAMVQGNRERDRARLCMPFVDKSNARDHGMDGRLMFVCMACMHA
jgi:cytochrome P450